MGLFSIKKWKHFGKNYFLLCSLIEKNHLLVRLVLVTKETLIWNCYGTVVGHRFGHYSFGHSPIQAVHSMRCTAWIGELSKL